MMTHLQLWSAIERVAQSRGWSLSRLARQAELDATVLNRSKWFGPEGKPRWPSSQTISLVLRAADMSFGEFCVLLDSAPVQLEEAGHADIMLVDDAADIREGYAMVLRNAGYRVRVAESHREVLRRIDGEQRFDLLCTDVVMPAGLGGPALARAARDRLPALKVMYITGFDIPGMAARADLCLRKPVAAEVLVAEVRGLLASNGPPAT